MIAMRAQSPRPRQALGAAAVLLATLAVWPWLVPPVPVIRPLATPPASPPASVLATLPPIASYAAIVERPLFAPSRRPPPGIAAATGAPAESRYRLVGIVANGARRKAFVADGARRIEIGEGDMLDGWTVKQIGSDRILLSSADGEAALRLKPAAAEPPKPQ